MFFLKILNLNVGLRNKDLTFISNKLTESYTCPILPCGGPHSLFSGKKLCAFTILVEFQAERRDVEGLCVPSGWEYRISDRGKALD